MSENDNEKLNLDDLAAAADGQDNIEIEVLTEDGDAPTADQTTDGTGECPINQLGAIYDVPVQISAVLGKTTMPIGQVLRLGRGAILELDRKVGEAIDVVVNNRLVARGEVVIIDERIGITMTEIIKSEA